MIVKVAFLSGKVVEIEVDVSTSVRHIKARIEGDYCIPLHRQHIYLPAAAPELNDDGVVSGSHDSLLLHLVVRGSNMDEWLTKSATPTCVCVNELPRNRHGSALCCHTHQPLVVCRGSGSCEKDVGSVNVFSFTKLLFDTVPASDADNNGDSPSLSAALPSSTFAEATSTATVTLDPLRAMPAGKGADITSISISTDGSCLIFSCLDSCTAQVWSCLSIDVSDWRMIHELTGHSASVLGTAIITGDEDDDEVIEDVGCDEAVSNQEGAGVGTSISRGITVGCWTGGPPPSSSLIDNHQHHAIDLKAGCPIIKGYAVTGSADRSVRVWSLSTGACMHVCWGNKSSVYAVALSCTDLPSSSSSSSSSLGVSKLLSSSTPSSVPQTSSTAAITEHVQRRRTIIVTSGGCDHHLQAWDAIPGTILARTSPSMTTTSSSSSASSCTMIKAVNVSTPHSHRHQEDSCHHQEVHHHHTQAVTAIAWNPVGTRLVSTSCDQTVCVWSLSLTSRIPPSANARTTQPLRSGFDNSYESGDDSVPAFTFSCLHVLSGHAGAVFCFSFLPFECGGRYVMTGSNDNLIKVWDIEDGTEVKSFRCDDGAIYGVGMSSEGDVMVTLSHDGTVKVWRPIPLIDDRAEAEASRSC